jgi:hypothetical protein
MDFELEKDEAFNIDEGLYFILFLLIFELQNFNLLLNFIGLRFHKHLA